MVEDTESEATNAVIIALVNVLMQLHNEGAPRRMVLNAASAVLLSLAVTLDAEDETRVALLQLGKMLKRQKAQKLVEEGQGQTRH